jgi:hypothetical protein
MGIEKLTLKQIRALIRDVSGSERAFGAPYPSRPDARCDRYGCPGPAVDHCPVTGGCSCPSDG